MTRICARHGCQLTTQKPAHPICVKHWNMLPKLMQMAWMNMREAEKQMFQMAMQHLSRTEEVQSNG